MTDFKTYMATVPADIDRRLQAMLSDWAQRTPSLYAPMLKPLCDAFADACADGKRLRAALVKLGYEMLAGVSDDRIYQPALAYELFQTAILGHDDIIDKSPLRRGRPTIFKVLEKRCTDTMAPNTDALHYGMSQTICLGDMGLFMSIQTINDCDFDPVAKNKAVSSFIQTVIDTIAGELIDVELPYLRDQSTITEDDLLAVCRYKTSRYTIVGPLSLGAVFAGADDATLNAIKDFGDSLGIAFQIKDDLLGVFGDEATIGKSVTSDCAEGKITLLYLYALQTASDAQKDFLAQHYGTGDISFDVHAQIKQIFIDTGAKEKTEAIMRDYAAKAQSLIPSATGNLDSQNLLHDLSDFMVNRVK